MKRKADFILDRKALEKVLNLHFSLKNLSLLKRIDVTMLSVK